MTHTSALRMYGVLAVVLVLVAAPARAQFQPRLLGTPVVGEDYRVEASAGFWSPSASMAIASEQFKIAGTVIDFKRDLGLTDHRFGELHLVLRPAVRHKFRMQYIPIKYAQGPITVTRDIIFNGQRFRVGVPVSSALNWNAYRLGYEFDFLTRERWFGGFVVDFKYTDVEAQLNAPFLDEYVRARAPIPAIGGIFRVYVMPNVSVTGEVTGFKLPANVIAGATGRYVDIDFYGTFNVTRNVGAQFGYRSFDLGYTVDTDVGDFRLKGIYFGGVGRF